MSEHLRRNSSRSSASELKVLLLGNIGCGKTLSADTVLGQVSLASTAQDSRSCSLRRGHSEGRSVTLVEAPRWYWSGSKMEDSVRKETQQAMTLVEPGLHAVLLLVPVNQFTEMDGRVPAELEELFGKEILDHTLVLLTCGDYLMGRTAEEYLQKEHPGLRQMIECCGGGYHVFNNRQRQERTQVQELLEKVESMVQKNGVYYMKTAQERELDRRVRERKRELMESYQAQKEEKKKPVSTRTFSNTETLYSEEESIGILERRRRREEQDELDGSVFETTVTNGLHSAPAPEQQSPSRDDRQLTRTPSFRLNADGAILSQISESKSTPKMISTLHHRINSFEEGTPETSPTSSLHSPVFSSFSSSPTFAASPSLPSSSSPPSSSHLSPSSPELRLVLLGRSGAGKSAAGNFILGQQAFESYSDSFKAITQKCEKKKADVEGKRVALVDTPDWFNSEQTPDEVRAQISSCVALSSPGPHAFLLCVPLDQPAKTELQALAVLENVFGPDSIKKHTLVLFTYTDRLRESGKAGNKTVEEYIASQRGDLIKLVEKCGDRYHIVEKKNVAELLEKVEQTVKEAGGQCYSCPAFQEAETRVRQRQLEMTQERRGLNIRQEQAVGVGQLRSDRQLLPQVEEDEEMRDEAEMSVSKMNIESIPPITLSSMSPSLLRSIMEKMESGAKNFPKLLAESSVWVGEGAKKMKNSPVWGKVGGGAQNVQKMVIDSSVWGKMGATAGEVSKAVGGRVPKVVVDGSLWVGSGAKTVASSPVWEKVRSNTKSLVQSPVWGKVGSGTKTGAKLVAESSMRVGSGIGAGAKKVAQSPVWGKVGSGAKAGAKMVAESSVWEKIGTTAKQVPTVVIGGAILGLVLGVILAGVIGGAVGAAAGSAVTEVGRRKFGAKNASEETRSNEKMVNSIAPMMKEGKSMKTE
ncbi:uncharacterized protein LOC108244325 [Kryptolebias marmoratus]|uniref:Uncharacterized LOC108244325 n=1 Tax=Kryptolebias marmoratus TaxID=37003 RepID=A0A3Q3B999_KRYMA|nr:uncharacterized protein LOC108244325 [Kryptolebias marmoratus]